MQFPGKRICDHVASQWAVGPAIPAGPLAPKYISLKHATACEVHLTVYTSTNAANSDITLLQATNTGGEGAKSLGFTTYLVAADSVNSDVLVLTNATSNTFTTITTAARAARYIIVVDPASLDTANSFDCLGMGITNAANTTVHAEYWITSKLGGSATNMPNFKTD